MTNKSAKKEYEELAKYTALAFHGIMANRKIPDYVGSETTYKAQEIDANRVAEAALNYGDAMASALRESRLDHGV